MESTCIELAKIFLATCGFVFATWKYFDQRQRELRLRSFKEFHEVLNLAVGRTKDGVVLTDVHQIAAVYQLREFQMFKEHLVPVLDFYLAKTSGDDSEFAKAVRVVRKSFSE